jgi:hypothetical protein
MACSIAIGFLLFLIYPFLFSVCFVCSTVLIGLFAFENPERLRRFKWPILAALMLALPAAVLNDPAGVLSGVAWIMCIGGGTLMALSHIAAEPDKQRFTPFVSRYSAALGMAAIILIGLIGVGRGQIIVDSGWRRGAPELTPQVRDIWLTVRTLTPKDALIFTDQTGPEPTLLRGWNSYSFFGQRQVFVSSYFNTLDLRKTPDVFRQNSAVLSGDLAPEQLHLSRHYSSYFAVVSRTSTVPKDWTKIYENTDYALYRL